MDQNNRSDEYINSNKADFFPDSDSNEMDCDSDSDSDSDISSD